MSGVAIVFYTSLIIWISGITAIICILLNSDLVVLIVWSSLIMRFVLLNTCILF